MRVPGKSGGADALGKAIAVLMCSAVALAVANASEIADAAKRGNVASVRDLAKAADAAALDQPGRDSMTALLWAAQANDIEIARTLLNAGADANLANRYGITPLWLAATNRSPMLVKLLLEHGANASAELPHGETALMAAARSGDAESIKLLIAAGGDPNVQEDSQGETALMWAAAENQADAIRALVAGGANPDLASRPLTLAPMDWLQIGMVSTVLPVGGWAPLLFAARENAPDAALALIEAGADKDIRDPDGLTALNLAIMNSHYDLAAKLIEAGVGLDVADRTGMTPLYGAVDMVTLGAVIGRPAVPRADENTGVDIIRLLLAKGANPNAKLTTPALARYHGFPDRSMGPGTTPLMRAARGRDLESIPVLLAGGADINARQDDGSTVMHVMVGAGRPFGGNREKIAADELVVFDQLVKAGADLQAVSNDGQSLVHRAARSGNAQLVELLVKNGVKVDAKDKEGRTALDLVSAPGRGNNPEMAALLKKLAES